MSGPNGMYAFGGAQQERSEQDNHSFEFRSDIQPSGQFDPQQLTSDYGVGPPGLNGRPFNVLTPHLHGVDPFALSVDPAGGDEMFWDDVQDLPGDVVPMDNGQLLALYDEFTNTNGSVDLAGQSEASAFAVSDVDAHTTASAPSKTISPLQVSTPPDLVGTALSFDGSANSVLGVEQTEGAQPTDYTATPEVAGAASSINVLIQDTRDEPAAAASLGSSLLNGFTDAVEEFDEEGAMNFFYKRRRKVEPKGGLAHGALDVFTNDKAGSIKKIKHAITYVRDLPRSMANWTLEDEADALMGAAFQDAVNALDRKPDQVYSAVATMVYYAFINLVIHGDHFNKNAMPNQSQFKQLDNITTPAERFDLILKGLYESKTLARHLLDGYDVVAQYVAAPHSRFKAVYQTAHSNAVKQQRTDEAREAREEKEAKNKAGNTPLARNVLPAEDGEMHESDNELDAEPTGKTKGRKRPVKPTEEKMLRALIKLNKRELRAAQAGNKSADATIPALPSSTSSLALLPVRVAAPPLSERKSGKKRAAPDGTQVPGKRGRSKK